MIPASDLLGALVVWPIGLGIRLRERFQTVYAGPLGYCWASKRDTTNRNLLLLLLGVRLIAALCEREVHLKSGYFGDELDDCNVWKAPFMSSNKSYHENRARRMALYS